jgi:uncharacterized membrane-anchored protein
VVGVRTLVAYAYYVTYRYANVSDADKVAVFGLATLVAVSAGSKTGRGVIAAIIGDAVLFLKKACLVVLLVLAGLGTGLKRWFRPGKTA